MFSKTVLVLASLAALSVAEIGTIVLTSTVVYTAYVEGPSTTDYHGSGSPTPTVPESLGNLKTSSISPPPADTFTTSTTPGTLRTIAPEQETAAASPSASLSSPGNNSNQFTKIGAPILGVVVGLALLGFMVFFWLRRHRASRVPSTMGVEPNVADIGGGELVTEVAEVGGGEMVTEMYGSVELDSNPVYGELAGAYHPLGNKGINELP